MSATFVTCVFIIALCGTVACGANLGVANDYNGFILGTDSQLNASAQGRVAIGGSASLSSYGIASGLTGFSGPSLVVGGDLTYTNSQVFWGDVHVGGTPNFTNVTISNGQLYNPSSPIDFAAASSYLTQQSSSWGALAPTGSTVVQFGGITLTGTDPSLNIFSVNGSDLASANSLTISAPANSTVLVNVNGTTNSMSNFGMTLLDGADKQYTLYNFYETSQLNISGINVLGSVLAPDADITFNNGNTEGTLIGSTISGNGGLQNFIFQGDLPGEEPIPDASTLVLAGMSCLAFASQKLRKSNRQINEN